MARMTFRLRGGLRRARGEAASAGLDSRRWGHRLAVPSGRCLSTDSCPPVAAVLVAAPGYTRPAVGSLSPALMTYRQSTAAILEEAQAIPEKVASQA